MRGTPRAQEGRQHGRPVPTVLDAVPAACVVLLLCLSCGVLAVQAAPERNPDETFRLVMNRLESLYSGGLFASGPKQLAERLQFREFGGVDVYSKGYFRSKPLVAFAGHFSTGKTTLIQDVILDTTYPGAHIAPEPATDTFCFITDGGTRAQAATEVPVENGMAVAYQANGAFEIYKHLGEAFLMRMQVIKVSHEDAPALKHFSIVDTPGIMENVQRSITDVDYIAAWQTIATHADLIVTMFDIKGGDVGPRYRRVLEHFAAVDHKVVFLFNKADAMAPHELTQAFGGIMWRLGRVFQQAEAERMFFGSFWDKPCNVRTATAAGCAVFDRSKQLLMEKLQTLPLEVALSRIGGFQLYLARLEALGKLLEFFKRQDVNFGSWLSACVNQDKNGGDLDDPKTLHWHFDRAVETYRLGTPVLPDRTRFVEAVVRAGGVCGLGSVPAYASIVDKARQGVSALYAELGRKPKAGMLQKLGIVPAEEVRGGHAFNGGVHNARADIGRRGSRDPVKLVGQPEGGEADL